MTRCKIVPAIDLIQGRCVRLRQGSFDQKEVVGEDPVAVAQGFERAGFSRLHVVDLDGARAGVPQHLETVKAIRSTTSLAIDFSGGLRSAEDIERALQSGAQQVVIGSAAVLAPDDVIGWIQRFGSESVIVGLDVLNGEVRIKGWQEGSSLSIGAVLERFSGSGLKRVMSTDIAKDGTLQGAAVDLYRSLCRDYPALSFIASGGIATATDLRQVAATGVSEIIVGKALYAGTLSLSDLAEFVW
jgi:phosphoribosylformimino-5-aminoimidazole carboxamide ribotide isomerase